MAAATQLEHVLGTTMASGANSQETTDSAQATATATASETESGTDSAQATETKQQDMCDMWDNPIWNDYTIRFVYRNEHPKEFVSETKSDVLHETAVGKKKKQPSEVDGSCVSNHAPAKKQKMDNVTEDNELKHTVFVDSFTMSKSSGWFRALLKSKMDEQQNKCITITVASPLEHRAYLDVFKWAHGKPPKANSMDVLAVVEFLKVLDANFFDVASTDTKEKSDTSDDEDENEDEKTSLDTVLTNALAIKIDMATTPPTIINQGWETMIEIVNKFQGSLINTTRVLRTILRSSIRNMEEDDVLKLTASAFEMYLSTQTPTDMDAPSAEVVTRLFLRWCHCHPQHPVTDSMFETVTWRHLSTEFLLDFANAMGQVIKNEKHCNILRSLVICRAKVATEHVEILLDNSLRSAPPGGTDERRCNRDVSLVLDEEEKQWSMIDGAYRWILRASFRKDTGIHVDAQIDEKYTFYELPPPTLGVNREAFFRLFVYQRKNDEKETKPGLRGPMVITCPFVDDREAVNGCFNSRTSKLVENVKVDTILKNDACMNRKTRKVVTQQSDLISGECEVNMNIKFIRIRDIPVDES